MKNFRVSYLAMVVFFVASILFTGCASLEHNKSHFKAVTEDGLIVAEDNKDAYTLTIFPSTEKVKNVSSAYSGAAGTNNDFHLKNEAQKHRFSMQPKPITQPPVLPQSDASGYLPEKSEGKVIFSMGNEQKTQKNRSVSPQMINDAGSVVLQNNSKDYDIRVLSGPFADGMPLSPGMISAPVSKQGLADKNGMVKIQYEWLNKNTGQASTKTIWRQIKPDTSMILVSDNTKY